MKENASVYDFKVKSIEGKEIPMSAYRGKLILIVNTASECGFTSQYQGLQDLYETYQDEGLEVLGFPCNQFGGQEPGNEEDIQSFCSLRFGVTFPLFEKVKVNGKEAHPLFKYLKKSISNPLGSMIKWNFTKFLIDKEGKTVKRFSPQADAVDIAEYLISRDMVTQKIS